MTNHAAFFYDGRMETQELAAKIVKTLRDAGYIAYFAGGWVRDFLMQHPSDDIDIATNASPEVIMRLFPHTVKVGLAFGIVIVILNGRQFEVATFRRDVGYGGGRKPEKIELATPEEDALRRDFTINGMFYDPLTDTIYDFVQGREDLEKGIIRTIGSPHDRFVEDRLRMVRAIRFASRFNFAIDEATQRGIEQNSHTLFPAVSMERIWHEFTKMSKFPRFDRAILEMHRLGLLGIIFPSLRHMSSEEMQRRVASFRQFPKDSPVILFLMELFPEMQLEELLDLCQYLKTSVREGKLVEFALKGRKLLSEDELAPHPAIGKEWAYFYADRFFTTCFDVLTAKLPDEKRPIILETHRQRHEKLKPHIQRIVENKPLVNAEMLKKEGIQPGKKMGTLLKLAEEIAISKDLHDPEMVIALLKQSPEWPQDS